MTFEQLFSLTNGFAIFQRISRQQSIGKVALLVHHEFEDEET